jgi:hypothetical protein
MRDDEFLGSVIITRADQALRTRIHHGPLAHQVIAPAAGQIGMAAAGQIRLAVVTPPRQVAVPGG